MDFQEVIMRLDRFWADKGCLIWQPYNVQVGAGTMNPATVLRVLGPEPWNVAYVEPSVRPDDGRYGENPNRWGQYYQYQVILKPDPGNPVELYLQSLEALGISTREHDIRLVEDNWEQPALGAWGLGWEIWMDGQEITQFTYFQQAGGFELNPVSVEITYGLERIVMVLQGVRDFSHIRWGNGVSYGDMLLQQEKEHCTYNFQTANVQRLHQMYDLFEAEAKSALQSELIIPAHDYVLKCSHTFNVLDARGAVGVTERAHYFARMRDLSREVSRLYLAQRETLGYPLLRKVEVQPQIKPAVDASHFPQKPANLLVEVGMEELPAVEVDSVLSQLRESIPQSLRDLRLGYEDVQVLGTPRRLMVRVCGLAPCQPDEERVVKGPPADSAFDPQGRPTKAALGFSKAQGVDVTALQKRDYEGKSYVVALKAERGRPAAAVLVEALPRWIAGIKFVKSMRWNESGVAMARALRWIVALLGDQVVPFAYAGVASGRVTYGLRPLASPAIELASADAYLDAMRVAPVMLDSEERRAYIAAQAKDLAASVGGEIPDVAELLNEVANLVEWPVPLLGHFAEEYLALPQEVLIAVMKKHQRYFPVMQQGKLLAYFVIVANGPFESLDKVRHGNEEVLRARYADAAFFYKADAEKKIEEYLPRLSTLAFQAKLGSVLDKVGRLEKLVPWLADHVGASSAECQTALRVAQLCKADLATRMVVELTSLQGIMGSKYATLAGEPPEVAQGILEHYLPRGAGDQLPQGMAGRLVGLADRIDSLVGLFAVGLQPTGSADPYGLRRAALGLVQILAEGQTSLSLREAFHAASDLLPLRAGDDALVAVQDFVTQRQRGWLLELGYRYDLVDATLTERADDPYLTLQTLRSLTEWVKRPEFAPALTAYSRPSRIVRDQVVELPLRAALLQEAEELALYEAVRAAQAQRASVHDVDGLLALLGQLAKPIDAFFDKVFVMVDDVVVRENRLALLQRIAVLPKHIVDLTKVLGY